MCVGVCAHVCVYLFVCMFVWFCVCLCCVFVTAYKCPSAVPLIVKASRPRVPPSRHLSSNAGVTWYFLPNAEAGRRIRTASCQWNCYRFGTPGLTKWCPILASCAKRLAMPLPPLSTPSHPPILPSDFFQHRAFQKYGRQIKRLSEKRMSPNIRLTAGKAGIASEREPRQSPRGTFRMYTPCYSLFGGGRNTSSPAYCVILVFVVVLWPLCVAGFMDILNREPGVLAWREPVSAMKKLLVFSLIGTEAECSPGSCFCEWHSRPARCHDAWKSAGKRKWRGRALW